MEVIEAKSKKKKNGSKSSGISSLTQSCHTISKVDVSAVHIMYTIFLPVIGFNSSYTQLTITILHPYLMIVELIRLGGLYRIQWNMSQSTYNCLTHDETYTERILRIKSCSFTAQF